MFESVTNDVHIMVEPRYLEEQSQPDKKIFAFSYIVTMVNLGNIPATLINRHWKVYSGEKQIADLKGEGVVGQNPELVTGIQFQYVSGTIIYDPVGSMKGSYTFQKNTGEFFDVKIPEFFLYALDSTKLN